MRDLSVPVRHHPADEHPVGEVADPPAQTRDGHTVLVPQGHPLDVAKKIKFFQTLLFFFILREYLPCDRVPRGAL